jgi:twitching motility protein PilT
LDQYAVWRTIIELVDKDGWRMNTQELLHVVETEKASDLHLKPDALPFMRRYGELVPLGNQPLSSRDLLGIFQELTTESQQEEFTENKELDFSYQPGTGSRYRVNASQQGGELCLALRRISNHIPALEELGLPPICQDLALMKQGLILFTGPTGSGKSTSLAAMIDYLNQQESSRVITIEDPIEYIYQDKKSFITQRELGADTESFATAAKQALRQDPDVILVGEMRDPETMAACLTAAETGHLVLSTLHTNNAPQSVDRMVDSFPPHQQNQIRMQLSLALLAILSQRLLPRRDGTGRIAAVEVMIANNAIRNLIREGKTHQMLTVMQTGSEMGMETLDQALQRLLREGKISPEEARNHSSDQNSPLSSLGFL